MAVKVTSVPKPKNFDLCRPAARSYTKMSATRIFWDAKIFQYQFHDIRSFCHAFTKDRSGRQQIDPKLTKEIKQSLGRRAEQTIEEDRNTAQEQRQRLEEAEKQLLEADKIAAEREKEAQEIQDREIKFERPQAKIDAIQENQGSNLESETELRRLKQLKKNQ